MREIQAGPKASDMEEIPGFQGGGSQEHMACLSELLEAILL